MILSPYHNPPYKSPSTVNYPSSPPLGPSPKRTRDEIVKAEVNVNLSSSVDCKYDGNGSPRTKIVDRFQDLDLEAPAIERLETGESVGSPRKRLRRHPKVLDGGLPHDSAVPTVAEAEQTGPLGEIGETPNCHDHRDPKELTSSSRSPSPTASPLSPTAPATGRPADETDDRLHPRAPSSSPTSPKALVHPPHHSSSVSRTPAPSPPKGSPPPRTSPHHWHDTEITGHTIDSGSDDDGEGINGIGFKPTPAIAWDRQQRRARQVREWRVREEREERDRRRERRQVGFGDGDEGNESGGRGRVVRFEEVG